MYMWWVIIVIFIVGCILVAVDASHHQQDESHLPSAAISVSNVNLPSLWIHMRYYYNNHTCESDSRVNYMFGVRGGSDSCLRDLDFLALFVPNDTTTRSYRFLVNDTEAAACSAVRLQRYFDHYCMDEDENGSMMIVDGPPISSASTPSTSVEYNNETAVWFGKCMSLWQDGASSGSLQYSCYTGPIPPSISNVGSVYSRYALFQH